MPRPDRKTAAANFRRHIRRSNELHAEYLNDPQFLQTYERFASWQFQHLLPYFSDLYATDGYARAIDFTISDLSGTGISSRDRDLERVALLITSTLPYRALLSAATAAEMNARVLQVNLRICRCLLVDGELPATITEKAYCIACREASSLDECVELVNLITDLGESLKFLVSVPMIGITLRAMNRPAHAAGFGSLQEFLETGYRTFSEIPDIDLFLAEIRKRMTEIFSEIYTTPLTDLP